MGKQKVSMKKVVAVFFQNEEKEILLVRRGMGNGNRMWPLKWHCVSGKVEKGETFLGCFNREVEEEVGLVNCEIKKSVILESHYGKEVFKVFVVLCQLREGEDVQLTEENLEYKWVAIEDIENMDITPVVIQDMRELGMVE
jgi:mutator protein MutT